MHAHLRIPEEGVGNWTPVLWRSRKCSELLNSFPRTLYSQATFSPGYRILDWQAFTVHIWNVIHCFLTQIIWWKAHISSYAYFSTCNVFFSSGFTVFFLHYSSTIWFSCGSGILFLLTGAGSLTSQFPSALENSQLLYIFSAPSSFIPLEFQLHTRFLIFLCKYSNIYYYQSFVHFSVCPSLCFNLQCLLCLGVQHPCVQPDSLLNWSTECFGKVSLYSRNSMWFPLMSHRTPCYGLIFL